ncbi:MAG: tRNA (adenosine(37)-N6)-threonylcarbamoyltransferase complex ATPase subunit type 1 TsaE [Verrucomicrobiota bacterium]|nr:tRNA (adenosine(37)-N6)-threonylcarbamoyltransferase complex ATPase subunit type 1 TsaE [Verrucomicrobiota bacterium]
MKKTEERLISRSPEETMAIAGRLTVGLRPGSIVALHGELGSGKTCFVQGMALALGIRAPVTSPSFTLINEYCGTLSLCHIDLYRLRGPADTLALGFCDYMESGGITAIEWAERAGDFVPPHAVRVFLETRPDDERAITIRRP